jgi:hypothetical protein
MFLYTFEGGRAEAVWKEVEAFANPDGGFGKAMEPDCRLPGSSTLATITAFPYLVDTNAPAHLEVVKNGIRYLTNTYDKKLKGWRMLPPEVNNFPRAAWWNFDPKNADKNVLERWINPSVCAGANLFRYSELVDPTMLTEVRDKALAELEAKKNSIEGHDYLAFIELAEAVTPDAQEIIWPILIRRATAAVVTDPSGWSGYGVRPLWAVHGPISPLFDALRDAVEAQLDFEIERQDRDGSWHPFWNWGRFEEEWAQARIEWQGQLTVKTLRSLRAFGRIA